MAYTLVIAEHGNGRIKRSSLSAVALATRLGAPFDILLVGAGLEDEATSARQFGARRVLLADHADLAQPLADRYAQVIAAAVRSCGATRVIAATSTFAKDILPRTAALVGAPMVSDIVAVDEAGHYKRRMYAGGAVATVAMNAPVGFITVRSSAFAPVHAVAEASPVESLPVTSAKLPRLVEFVSREVSASPRPDATEARIVVSGGRALKTSAEFERLIGGLADVLGGAVGSSRALVDQGISSNSLQIGQTGKTVAPDLYLAIGVSGAVQHLAGIKDARYIAAINTDANAPIFGVADFGLVADLNQAVPQLIEKLKK